ncbi:MAG: helix-turn-helix domain-containing protein [Lachnospiraceae bacterium]|nr:helix-turn-helix domain-containing protein [Lachnospiraceae bacterium]
MLCLSYHVEGKLMDMNRILDYMEAHLEEKLTNAQLAELAGYSEYHFLQLFKAYTGETVMEYLCRRRLFRAMDDLVAGSKIIDVAFRYGFESHSAFSRAFKREFGFSPSFLRTLRLELDCIGGNCMEQIFLNSTKLGTPKGELFAGLKELLKKNDVVVEEAVLDEVYGVACKVYEGKCRYCRDEFVTHTINVAMLLADMGADADTILAGLFSDISERNEEMDLEAELPENVWNVVKNIDLWHTDRDSCPEEVLLIKLAERLHNMRTIEYLAEEKRAKKAKETLELYLPLARKVNNQKLLEELNDLGRKYS